MRNHILLIGFSLSLSLTAAPFTPAFAGSSSAPVGAKDFEALRDNWEARSKAREWAQVPVENRKIFDTRKLIQEVKDIKSLCRWAGMESLQTETRENQENAVFQKLAGDLHYFDDESQFVSKGDDFLVGACLQVLMQEADSDHRLIRRVLKQASLTPTALRLLSQRLEDLSPSEEVIAAYADFIAHPSTSSFELSSVLNRMDNKKFSSSEILSLAKAIMASRSFQEEATVLSIRLLSSARQMSPQDRLKFFEAVASQPKIWIEAPVLANFALSSPSPDADYSGLYQKLVRNVDLKTRIKVLHSFLSSEVVFSIAPKELASLLEKAGPSPFFDYAASEAEKTRYLSLDQVLWILEGHLRQANVEDGDLFQIANLTGGKSLLSAEQRSHLLRLAAQRGASSSEVRMRTLNSAYNIIRQDSSAEAPLMQTFSELAEKFPKDQVFLRSYEQFLSPIRTRSLKMAFAKKLLQSGLASDRFLLDIATEAVQDNPKDLSVAVEALRGPNLSVDSLTQISRALKMSYFGKTNLPELDAVILMLEKHPLTNAEIQRTARDMRNGGFSDSLDETDILDRLIKKKD